VGVVGDCAADLHHNDELGKVVIRFGLCCIFQEQPIKFATTTATAIGRMNRVDALAKLSRLCLQNADALLASLRYCAGNEIGCFRVKPQILPVKTHPTSGYTGISNDVPRRIEKHNAGTASRYTRSRLPVVLVYREEQPGRSQALKRKLAIKGLSRQEKEKLIKAALT
jgi:predicted GIY-YIG superfamily endonuclease